MNMMDSMELDLVRENLYTVFIGFNDSYDFRGCERQSDLLDCVFAQ